MIMDILESKGLEDTILPAFIKPVLNAGENDAVKIKDHETLLKAWKVNNGKAKVAIRSNCQSQPQDLLLSIKDAPTM
jgi:hypothetical protein